MHILALPIEIQTQILGELPWHDHFITAEVCPLWASILQRDALRSRRHYDHAVPAGWDLVEHLYPVFRSLTPRVTEASAYTALDRPNTHVLLEQGVLMFEVHSDGRTTIFIRVPKDLVAGTLSDREVLRTADPTNADSTQYAEFWDALCPDPEEYALLDISDSPLLSSDKLIFSVDDFEGEDTSTAQLPGVPDGPRILDFKLWNWNKDVIAFQHFGTSTTPSGLALDDLQWCLKAWDWPLGSPHGLVETIKSHLQTHVWCTSDVQTCFCQVSGLSIYGSSPGETVNITIAAFPAAQASTSTSTSTS